MKYQLFEGGYPPTRAHFDDAGIDLRTPYAFTLEHGESMVIDLKIAFQIPVGYCGILKSKSGLNAKCNIQSVDGVIDSGYRGSIKARIVNNGTIYRFEAGDKICQMVVLPCLLCDLEQVPLLDDSVSARNDAGFGSTGK